MTNENIEKLDFKYVLINFLYRINDSLFYAFIIQIILVSYCYFKVGKNLYWKVLYYSSWFGLCGAIIEKICIVWTEHPNNNNNFVYVLYIINEPFWIISEYTIPYLNMIKLKAIISKKKGIILKIYIGILFTMFVLFRIRIGVLRYQEKEAFNNKIYHAHGFSFMTLAVAEFSCTIFLLRQLSKDYNIAKRKGHNGNIYEYSKKSSYFILLVIDICGFILAILSMISNYTIKAFLVVFHCLKSNFVLILAVDSLVFKIENYDDIFETQTKDASSNIFNSTNVNYSEQSSVKINYKEAKTPFNTEVATPSNIDIEDIKISTSKKTKDLSNSYKLRSIMLNQNIFKINKNDENDINDDDININNYKIRNNAVLPITSTFGGNEDYENNIVSTSI
eukprot:jgi/Orpsp1_1/1177771/evm.model.c7180000062775.2